MTSERPNILWLVNDHQAYYRHGWDGGPRPLTPHFDRLAAQGVQFQRSYAATPLCGPARRTLLTGLYPHNHQHYYNYSEQPHDREVYLSHLAQAGYRNFYFGKWHAGPGLPADLGCEGFSSRDYGNPYISATYHDYLRRYGLPPAEHWVERAFLSDSMRRLFPDLREQSRYRCNQAWCGEHAVGLTLTPKETHESFFLANLACEALEQLARDRRRPFHLRVDFWGPHQPYFPTQEYANLYRPENIPEYGSFRDDLVNRPDLLAEERNAPLGDANGRLIIPSALPWSEWQLILARAYAHISMIDAAGGQILDRLQQLGLSDNTLVIWTADHGDAVVSHGGHFDKGSYLTEEIIRVPLAMRFPGRIAPGQVCDRPVCSIDLPVTTVGAAETAFERRVDGRNLLPLATGQAESWPDDVMVETFGHGYGLHYQGRALLAGPYKYVYWGNQPDELYDLEADPYELNNLATDPNGQAILAEMAQRLAAWQRQTQDPGFDDPGFQAAVAGDEDKLLHLAVLRDSILRDSRPYV
ncbi:MAG TPA: hypothetical protein DEP84_18035 [Chloroflexi bacterium]|nr:hypothetical protein [Chloroflexota bacterium]